MTQPFFPCDLWSPGHERGGSRTAALRDHAGTSFDDSYVVGSKLGDGMTAVVYMVTDKRTGQSCACKLAERRPQRPHWSTPLMATARLSVALGVLSVLLPLSLLLFGRLLLRLVGLLLIHTRAPSKNSLSE